MSTRGFLLSRISVFLITISCLWQRRKAATFYDRVYLYLWCHRSVTWPELKVTKLYRPAWMGVSHAKFQLSIVNSSGAIARKPSGGGTNPLGRRGLSSSTCSITSCCLLSGSAASKTSQAPIWAATSLYNERLWTAQDFHCHDRCVLCGQLRR